MKYCWIDSPIGRLLAAETQDVLRVLRFPGGSMGLAGSAGDEPHADWEDAKDGRSGVLAELRSQLSAYFGGRLRKFELPLDPQGSDFQRSVWAALRTIPYGETVSYGALAQRIGRPTAARAVGAANGRNPIPIVIPCHRVIGSGGGLTGFGGGLDTKRTLLELEGVQLDG